MVAEPASSENYRVEAEINSVHTPEENTQQLRQRTSPRTQQTISTKGQKYMALDTHEQHNSGEASSDPGCHGEKTEMAERKKMFRPLIAYNQLPAWAKDNEFIQRYYRPISGSWTYSTCSIFQLHNETFNIWSHLVPSILCFFGAAYYTTIPSTSFNDPFMEKSIFVVFMVCATVMLTCSWFFHAYYQHSYGVFCWTSKLDYTGIAFMIVGSFIPWVYYAFYCQQTLQLIYTLSIISLGLICVLVSCLNKFAEPAYRPIRAVLFAALGLSAVVPATHAVIVHGFSTLWNDYYLGALALMGFLYLFGAYLFATQFPECRWPGRFDLAFCSHNLFHLCVVAAAVIHFIAIHQLQVDRKALGNDCIST